MVRSTWLSCVPVFLLVACSTGGEKPSSTDTDDGLVDTDTLPADTTPSVSDVVVTASTDADMDGDPSTAAIGDTLACSWTFAGAEGLADESTVEWFVNAQSVGSASSLSGEFLKEDTVTCTVTPHDGTLEGLPVSGSIDIDNTPPAIVDVSINPDPAVLTDVLGCSYSGFSDADGDPDESAYQWLVNGASAGSSASLLGSFVKGDLVTCTVAPNDGSDMGTPRTASLTISNIPPVASGLSISPASPSPTDTLTCSYAYYDGDSDPSSSTVSWSVDGAVVGSGPTLAGAFDSGDTVTCTVTPADDEESGTPISGSVTILLDNDPPSVSSVNITPNPAYATDTLTCNYAYSDPEGDPDNSTVEWFMSGLSVGTGSTLSTGFGAGDLVVCTVTANDGFQDGSSVNTTLTISNTMPTATNVSISPDPATISDTLSCSYTFNDIDGDPDNSTLEWFINNVSAGSSSTLAGGFNGGDLIECAVTPSDGISSAGVEVSAFLTVDNAAPTVSGVTVLATTDADGDADPATAVAGDTLECTWTFSDSDGGSDNSTVAWTDGSGTSLGTGATLSGAFVGSDTVTCTVTPSDGGATGTPVSGSIVIGNSAPSVTVVSVDPQPAYEGDTLTCSFIGYYDPDGDPGASTGEWTINGVIVGTAATLSSGFVEGDTVMCTVYPSDGMDTGTPVSDSVVISALVVGSCDTSGEGYWAPSSAIIECDVLDETNYRRSLGADCGTEGIWPAAGPLTMNADLSYSARVHTDWMAGVDTLTHDSPGGPLGDDMAARITAAGYNWITIGENVAAGYATAQSVVDGWMTSDGHCANIMNGNFEELGVGYVYDSSSTYGYWWTQNFGAQ